MLTQCSASLLGHYLLTHRKGYQYYTLDMNSIKK
uniref:Uncharacterized protein n=1 Tax=Anguilla anguilla TaxID=7936 RepID=A0A0E9XQQ0_ANGAN